MVLGLTKKLRICMVTTSKVDDQRAYSGTVFHIHKALHRAGAEVDVLDQVLSRRLILRRALGRAERMLTGIGAFQVERTWHMARAMARVIDEHLEHHPADVVFSNSSLPISLVKHDVPLAFFTDATFRGLRTLYPELQDYPDLYLETGEELERLAIQRASCAIYASEWAAQSAILDYGACHKKVHVLPRGSSMGGVRSTAEVEHAIALRAADRCELLFVGVSWERKGGALAAEVMRSINERGIPTKLTVVGCEPPKGADRSNMEVHPFLDKGDAKQMDLLAHLFLRSHFLLVPSTAECFGIVFTEAASLGVPSLTRQTGGVSNSVHHNRSGFILPESADAEAYVETIASLLEDPTRYRSLCQSTYRSYQENWDWGDLGHKLTGLLAKIDGQ